MKLLIVDDSSIVRRSIQRHLDSGQISQVFQAKNGQEAVAVFQTESPDVVTLDITMPEMDGLECLKKIMEINVNAKVLVISALADKATAIKAVKTGACGYVYKPFTGDELNEAFSEIVNS